MEKTRTIVRFVAGITAIGYLLHRDPALAVAIVVLAEFVYWSNSKARK